MKTPIRTPLEKRKFRENAKIQKLVNVFGENKWRPKEVWVEQLIKVPPSQNPESKYPD